MKRVFLLLILTIGLVPSIAQEGTPYPSLPSKILSNYAPTHPESYTPEVMAESAKIFLASLDETLSKQAALEFESHERGRWTNVPPRGPQGGVRLGDLNEQQLKLACDFLASVLSPQGYYKARGIPLADDRLLNNGKRRPGFGAEDYWIAIFGEPSSSEPWAMQFDGHHLAINLTFHGNKMSMSPTFIGTQPRDFKLGETRIEPMAKKDQAALIVAQSLDKNQTQQAVIGNKRGKLVAGAGRDGRIPEPKGVSCATFSKEQRDKLKALIQLYVADMPKPFAERRMQVLDKEIDSMTFGWWGPIAEKGDYSYRVQGPSLIIEYGGQDLGGDPHEHLHSMYRDPTNEYGDGMIKKD